MVEEPRRQRGVPRRLLLLCLCALLAIWVTGRFATRSGLNLNQRSQLVDLMDGTAHRPFVYRTLLPSAARLATRATPAGVVAGAEAVLARSELVLHTTSSLRSDGTPLYTAVWVLVLIFGSLVGYAATLAAFARELFDDPRAAAVAPLLGLAVLPLVEGPGYVYDFPQLFLFALCLYLLARQRWPAYLAAFSLGCLNKETTLLVSLVYAVHYRNRLGRGEYLRYGLAQLALFAVIRGGLALRFADNPGAEIEFHLDAHLRYFAALFARPSRLLQEPALFVLLALGAVGAFRWREKPAFLRSAAWLVLPFVALYLLGGFPRELRVFYDLHAIGVLLATGTLVGLAGTAGRR